MKATTKAAINERKSKAAATYRGKLTEPEASKIRGVTIEFIASNI